MQQGSITIWLWKNKTRWYEAEIYVDLLGDLLLIQRWGGLKNSLIGQKINIVPNLKIGTNLLYKIHKKRKRRNPPYKLVNVKSFKT